MTGWLLLGGALFAAFGLIVFRGAPYVPSKSRDVRRAFTDLYPLSDRDVLVDIGSGDGKVLRIAASFGARAIGYELNPFLVVISKLLSRDQHISVRLADFWRATLPHNTTVVYTFGDSRDIEKMAGKVKKHAEDVGRSIYFISYAFSLKDDVPAKKTATHYLYRFTPLHHTKA